jgi:hypothetical protein
MKLIAPFRGMRRTHPLGPEEAYEGFYTPKYCSQIHSVEIMYIFIFLGVAACFSVEYRIAPVNGGQELDSRPRLQAWYTVSPAIAPAGRFNALPVFGFSHGYRG